MRLTTKGRFAVTAMIDLALRQQSGPVTLSAISQRQMAQIMRDYRKTVGARTFGFEQRQLATPSVRADEREALGALDHVHAEVRRREVGDLVVAAFAAVAATAGALATTSLPPSCGRDTSMTYVAPSTKPSRTARPISSVRARTLSPLRMCSAAANSSSAQHRFSARVPAWRWLSQRPGSAATTALAPSRRSAHTPAWFAPAAPARQRSPQPG